MEIRTYAELMQIESFEDRFEYLKLDGIVGNITFGFDRYLNQMFYTSPEWKRVRDIVILRDNACDLAHPDHQIYKKVIVHHMNPICQDDIIEHSDNLLNPDFLVCVSHLTHEAIHYSNDSILPKPYIERTPGDTKLW